MQNRIPVDQSLAPVDQSLLMQSDKDFPHRAGQIVIHREAFAAPVQRGTHTAQLLRYRAAGFLLPLPYPLNEGLAAKVMPGFPNSVELSFDHHLGCNPGMIGSGLPQGFAAGHPVISDQGIHNGVLKGMPHVKAAGDIRRGN